MERQSNFAFSVLIVRVKTFLFIFVCLMGSMSGAAASGPDKTASVTSIDWQEWRAETFAEAKRLDKPLFLYMSAVWCMNCHILEEKVLGNQEIADYINKNFIAMRVDADERPDVAERYVTRGLPTFSFLMPDGKVIVQGNNIPLSVFRKNMKKVISLYDNKRDKIFKAIAKREGRETQYTPSSSERLTRTLADDVEKLLAAEFDAEFGGFGDGAKFPLPYNLEFLLLKHYLTGERRYLEMVVRSLSSMGNGLMDTEEGGFYRYSVSRDWKSPHYEKMLDTNARLLTIMLDTYALTKNTEIMASIATTMVFLEGMLFDVKRGVYYSSQDAEDGSYYRLNLSDRKKRQPPYVDKRVFTSTNGKMALALIKAAAVFNQIKGDWRKDSGAVNHPDYMSRAVGVFDYLAGELRGGDGLMLHMHGISEPILEDQIVMASLAINLYEVTGDRKYLDFGVSIAELTIASFWDVEKLGFYSFLPRKAVSAYRPSLKSMEYNAWAVDLFWKLYYLTKNDAYKQIAGDIFRAFPEAESGVDMITSEALPKFAAVLEKYLSHPLEAKLMIGSAEKTPANLLSPIMSAYSPMRIVKIFSPDKNKAEIEMLGYPIKAENMAYLCVKEICVAADETKLSQAMKTIDGLFKRSSIIE